MIEGGLPVLLFIIFLVLKLTGSIDWSWWWVTSPLWIAFILWVFIIVPAFLIARNKAKQARNEVAALFAQLSSDFDRKKR